MCVVIRGEQRGGDGACAPSQCTSAQKGPEGAVLQGKGRMDARTGNNQSTFDKLHLDLMWDGDWRFKAMFLMAIPGGSCK